MPPISPSGSATAADMGDKTGFPRLGHISELGVQCVSSIKEVPDQFGGNLATRRVPTWPPT